MKRILIIGVGWEQIPLVKKAKEKGLYVIVTTWWDEKKIPADKAYLVDSRDLDAIDRIISKENPDYITADECDYSMYAVAFFVEKYRFYGPGLNTQTITNNKFLQRECISKTSVPQPAYKLCWSLEMARNFANEIGYPVMVKPVDNRGSIGITKLKSHEDFLNAWLLAIGNSYSRVCIIEKCINGKVITADGFHDSEKFEFIAASNKVMYQENSNVAKILYYPGEFSSDIQKKIKKFTEITAKAVGIDFGFSHTEFIVEDGTDEIYFVEIANRGGGVYISNIVLNGITGVDYCGALLDMAMGKKVSIRCGRDYIRKGMLYFLDLSGEEPIEKYVDTISEHCAALYVNSEKENLDVKEEASAGRQGVMVCLGDDFDELRMIGKDIERTYRSGEKEYFLIRGEG